MIKNIIILLVIIVAAIWGLQTYTDYKAVDATHSYLVKADWGSLNPYKAKAANWILMLKTADAEKQLNVFIRSNGFVPNSNAIKKGANVTWTNEDGKNHSVAGENWGSAQLGNGDKYSKKFSEPGTYKYHCVEHPSETGEIVVD